MMRLNRPVARRIGAAAAASCAAILIPAVALAAPGQSASSAAPAAVSRCTVGDLTTWVGVPATGAAGNLDYQLELSNTSRHACTLDGFPGVSATGPRGRRLGSPAARNPSHPVRLVTLSRGATAHVELNITDAANFPPSACHPVTATGLRVYAPNAFRSETVPFSFRACQQRGPKFLHVSATIRGTGIPDFSF